MQADRGRTVQSEGVVEFPVSEQLSVAGDGLAVEFSLDLAVEIDTERVISAVALPESQPSMPRAIAPMNR